MRKITIDQLRPGMVIHSFPEAFSDETFHYFGKPVADYAEIQHLRELGVRRLFVQTPEANRADGAPTMAQIERDLEAQLIALGEEDDDAKQAEPDDGGLEAPDTDPLGSMEQELPLARRIQEEANRRLSQVFQTLRAGGSVDLPAVRDTVDRVAASVERDPQAMLSLSLLKNKEAHTFVHSINVSVLSMAFHRSQGRRGKDLAAAGLAGLVHDLGLVKIPQEILNKPGPLNSAERAVARRHVPLGLEILAQMETATPAVRTMVAQHHERRDGSGYPEGLKGDAISRDAQILGAIDVFEALTAARPYRKTLENHQALRRLMEWSRTLFDGDIIQAFIRCVGVYPVGTLVRCRNGCLGLVISNHAQRLLFPLIRLVFDHQGRRLENGRWLNLFELRNDPGYQITSVAAPARHDVDPLTMMPG